MSKIPIYQTIKNAILAKIHSGDWVAGSAIPAEITLSEQFGVSRMTVNRALKELTDERILERRQGSGTFVAQKKFSHTFVEIRNIAKDISESGKHYHAQVLEKTTISFGNLPLNIQQVFRDKPKAVHLVRIVHFADTMPLQLEERWVSADLLPDFNKQDFSKINTSNYLINAIPLESGQYQIMAELADQTTANILQINTNSAILVLERTTLSQGKVITFVKMSHAGERYRFLGEL